MITAGRYTARALSAELGFANNGNEQVCVLFEIIGPDFPGEHVHWFGSFSEKAARITLSSLKNCGWKGQWSTWDGLSDNEVQLVVEDETGEDGRVRTRVKWVNALGGGGLKNVMDESQKRVFAAKMKGMVAEVLSSNGQQPKPAAPRQAPPVQRRPPHVNQDADIDTDNIPF